MCVCVSERYTYNCMSLKVRVDVKNNSGHLIINILIDKWTMLTYIYIIYTHIYIFTPTRTHIWTHVYIYLSFHLIGTFSLCEKATIRCKELITKWLPMIDISNTRLKHSLIKLHLIQVHTRTHTRIQSVCTRIKETHTFKRLHNTSL